MSEDQQFEQKIVAAGATAPRVTPGHIDQLMARVTTTVEHRPGGTTSTLVHAFLDGTFYLASGHSACVDPANYRTHLGEEAAKKKAVAAARDKLWELEGYRLYMGQYAP